MNEETRAIQPISDQMLTSEEVARLLGVRTRTLGEWRRKKCGPAYVRYGTTSLRYFKSEVEKFIYERLSTQAP